MKNQYHYRPDMRGHTGDLDTLYVGPMADEVPWAMHHEGRILNPINIFGYTTLAIQALADKMDKQEEALKALEAK